MRIDALENALQDHRPGLIYVAPTYHNPTGSVMPMHRRRQLLALAKHYGVPMLEDAVYHELGYRETPPPPLKAFDEDGVVIHASGFSKILLPGTRIGYVIANGPLWDRLAHVKQAADVCTPGLNQRAMQLYLASGALVGHLNRVRAELRARCEVACDAASVIYRRDRSGSSQPAGCICGCACPTKARPLRSCMSPLFSMASLMRWARCFTRTAAAVATSGSTSRRILPPGLKKVSGG